MRKFALAGTAILALSLALTACSNSDDSMNKPTSDTSSSSQMSSDDTSASSRMGDFEGLNDKKVSGTVEVTDSQITLSGFSSDEGPDLHIYLTKGTDEAAVDAGMEIDAVAFDKASQTFELKDVDVADYNTVVIHCDKAKAVFGAASLDGDNQSASATMGTFSGLNDKKVSGTVKVTDSQITLSGFSSDEGPDLHIYLTKGTDEAAVEAGVEIDAVAFDKASQTFSLKDVQVADYNTVVIHCDKAKAVFGAAPLS